MKFPESGLYAITQTEGKTMNCIVQEVEAALNGGVQVLQYRDKNPQDEYALGNQLLQLCRARAVPLLINDNPELALALGADGVHLGRDDSSIESARTLLGSNAIIGVSCYNDVKKAQRMQAAGADYVAFGRFFPSSSKPLATAAEIATLALARQALNIPIVAIGGILPENGGQLLAAGANLLAVIGGIFDNDPETAARAYRTLFAQY
ncbi:MAG: thiamine phosphate synthase [Methylococcales bacterium]|nr:thiamine phosphate synthase [Methylococcales bacterium]